MAYLKLFTRTCDEPGCGKTAVVVLLTNANEVLGYFCSNHGNRRWKERQRIEKLTWSGSK